jgi:hypothetical protein
MMPIAMTSIVLQWTQRRVEGWSSPGLMDTQLSPSKMGYEGVFSAKTESKAGETAKVYA